MRRLYHQFYLTIIASLILVVLAGGSCGASHHTKHRATRHSRWQAYWSPSTWRPRTPVRRRSSRRLSACKRALALI